jgi:hypothetical protein
MATNNYGKTNFKSGYNIQASVNDQQRGNNENLEQNKTQHCTRDESNRMTNNAIMEQLGQLESYQFAILADNNSANAINSIDVVPQLELKLGNNTITMVIDTGAAVNMIDDATFQNLSEQPELEICNRQYYAYGEDKAIKIVGQFVCEISYRSKTIKAAFLVANDGHQNLLSYRTSVQLGIVNIINKIEESQIVGLYKKYPNIFSGKLGKLKDEVFEIITDPSIKPTQQKLRKVPRQLQEEVTKELVEMEKEGIIERVRWPTSWVSNIVAVPKSGTPLKVRITCDMRGLNKAIKRIKYPITTIDDVIYKANGAKWFSKLDMRKAYHQLVIAEESRDLTTIITHCGLFRYTRMTMGIASASEIFSETIRRLIEDNKGASNISDDILVFGKTKMEHDENLADVLGKLDENGFTLNKEKCELFKRQVIYFGLKFSADGISLTDEKIKALKEATAPVTVSELNSYMGLAVFASRFIENFSTVTAPLRELAKSSVKELDWKEEHEESFQHLKEIITTKAMGYFNIKWDTILIVDASPVGLGAILAQYNPTNQAENHIIGFGSRLLTDVERRYSQCEKEGLTMVWGCEKFYLQIFGRHFILVTDNKAIELIFKNPYSTPPARIERWALRLSQFDYEVIHRPGKFNMADFFSRHPIELAPKTTSAERFVNMIVNFSTPNALSIEEVINATKHDKNLIKLTEFLTGMNSQQSLLMELGEYKHILSEITLCDNGVLLRNHQIIIPKRLQDQVLKLSHFGHQGIVKTKELLRSKVWFPGINKKVEEMIKMCNECQCNRTKQNIELLRPSSLPQEPWQELSVDFYGPMSDDNKYWLVLIDDYSRFPIVKTISSTAADEVIPALEEIMSVFGTPKVLKSDNGPPFNSIKFKDYSVRLNFLHKKITPYWPRANGEAEKFMINLSKVRKNAQVNGNTKNQELMLFLRAYRATPHCVT